METLQIIRLPKKYADIVQILSLEEKGKLLDAILFYEQKNIELEWTTKTLFELIKVDLDNLHKRACAGSLWGRPKKKPKVIETSKPKVMQNDNLKKRREEKRKEEKISNISKEIKAEPKTYWNTEINQTLDFLKNIFARQDWKESQKVQRQYWKHLLNYIKKHWKEKIVPKLNFLKNDTFHFKNCWSLKYIYNTIKGLPDEIEKVEKTEIPIFEGFN